MTLRWYIPQMHKFGGMKSIEAKRFSLVVRRKHDFDVVLLI